jgi:hypothetical protein
MTRNQFEDKVASILDKAGMDTFRLTREYSSFIQTSWATNKSPLKVARDISAFDRGESPSEPSSAFIKGFMRNFGG